MSWTPTDEQVEKAARALAYNMTNGLVTEAEDQDRDVARAVLVAVGPTIAASALRDAAAETKTVAYSAFVLTGRDGSPEWDAKFHEVPVLPQGASTMLRERADTIEKEAGR